MRTLLALLAGAVVAATAAVATAAPPTTHDFDPVFSPDGRTIAFVRNVGQTWSLMLISSDGRHLRTLVPNVYAQYLAWSPDGRSLAYSTGAIWRVDLASPTPQRLTPPSADPYAEALQPDWSPDGSSIAYMQFERCFRCTGIWVMNADGSSPHELLQDGRRPTWSPDGTKLAVSLDDSALVIGLDGSTVLPGGGAYVTWSPHGAYVAYTRNGLWIANLATGKRRRITKYMAERPSWSPDGKVIAGGTAGLVELVRVKDGKRVALLRDSTAESGVPSWSPDGRVAFVHGGDCGIDVAREDGTGLRRLTRTC